MIYDYFTRHRPTCLGLLTLIIVVCVALSAQLRYSEDINDFLPLDDEHQHELQAYQHVMQADRIVVVFEWHDDEQAATATTNDDTLYDGDHSDDLALAVERFAQLAHTDDTLGHFASLSIGIDNEAVEQLVDFVYANAPLLLTSDDYARIDSTLTPDYVDAQLAGNRALLTMPTGSLVSENIAADPLHLFTPLLPRLQQVGGFVSVDLSDDYFFSPDHRQAYALLTTPFGSSETSHNLLLINHINDIAQQVESEMPHIAIHATGAPVIAVGNARQIKHDSLLAIVIAATLILAILIYTLRSVRSLLAIVVSIAFGALFALAGMSLLHDSVSIIVVGMGSVIVGIAVNYPLHLVAHLRHQPDVRQALREIASPLIIGNITTVAAFVSLVPMGSTAMRDLGLFAAFMLVGTILFVIIFLPHGLKAPSRPATAHTLEPDTATHTPLATDKHSTRHRLMLCLIVAITAFLGYHSLDTTFDADISHINYVTDQQRADMQQLERMAPTTTPIYITSEGRTPDQAARHSERLQPLLDSLVDSHLAIAKRSATTFMPSCHEQQQRRAHWQRLLHDSLTAPLLTTQLRTRLAAQGFNPEAFTRYDTLCSSGRCVSGIAAAQMFTYTTDTTTTVIDMLLIDDSHKAAVLDLLAQRATDSHIFDAHSMSCYLANTLNNEFNYVGIVCSAIVFVFLWLSFRRFKIALIAFMPMVVSWLWILGLMSLLDLQFNIVNVILATFIFGQGDDYTIFITEGLLYEQRHHQRILPAYRRSIIISALIMFVGIGSLIVARHPALLSLSQVTIVGMATVVLMACTLTPLLFKLLIKHKP